MSERSLRSAALSLLLGLAAAQRLWNLFMVPPLTGYDSPGHAGYMLTIVLEGRLPQPHEGWSTFHPPLYYLLGAAAWVVAEPFGPRVLVAAVGAIGALAGLLAAFCAYRAVLALGHGFLVAWVACALSLFVPVAQLAGVMLGNEALVAGFASGVFLLSIGLQRDPTRRGAAVAAGSLAGLALATKYTGAFALPALLWPFACAALCRAGGGALPSLSPGAGAEQETPMPRSAAAVRSEDRSQRSPGAGAEQETPMPRSAAAVRSKDRSQRNKTSIRPAALALGICALLATPSYLRNLALAGELLPMTRSLEPMRSAEAGLVLRPRRVTDYLTLPWEALRRPSLYHEPGRLGSFRNRNAAMSSVPGLFHASLWYDPFGHRTSVRDHRDGVWYGPVLTLAGLLPTLLVGLGLLRSLARTVRTRGAAPEAPLAVSALLAFATFLWITWTAPSAAAVKGSYLLPLLVPAAVFFAGGVELLSRPLRGVALAVSALAAALAGLVFTADLLYPSLPMGVRVWLLFAEQLPRAHIREAMERMLIGW